MQRQRFSPPQQKERTMNEPIHLERRQWLRCAATAAAGLSLAEIARAADEPKNRVKQSIVHWCFKKHWDVEQTCKVAKQLGCVSVELVDPKEWATLKKYGLVCAIASSYGFEKGMNNPKYQEMCIDKMRKSL